MNMTENNKKTVALSGRIDSNNADEVLKSVLEKLGDDTQTRVELDASDLEYISSAGLRMILKLKKTYPDLSVINVSPQVYEILDMTGFTQMFKVERAYRAISIDGCEEIGWGANSRIYRIDEDNVVKVYSNDNALDKIRLERDMAKLALILDIPTAISYEIVKVGSHYGAVFEMLDPVSFSTILIKEPEKLEWCVDESIDLLKKIHSITAPEGRLPDMRDNFRICIDDIRKYLPDAAADKLYALQAALPFDPHIVHGDYHTKNLILSKGEVLLIDMETLSMGHPVFELSSMFNAYMGFSEFDHENIRFFQGYDYETAVRFWCESLKRYLGTDDEKKIGSVEEKARIIGYVRMIRYVMRRNSNESKKDDGRAAFWLGRLTEYLERTDSLLF